METASFVFRRMTQPAAASSAPHSSPQPALPRPGAPQPTLPPLPGRCWAEGLQNLCPDTPLPRPGWGRAAGPTAWADPRRPQPHTHPHPSRHLEASHLPPTR